MNLPNPLGVITGLNVVFFVFMVSMMIWESLKQNQMKGKHARAKQSHKGHRRAA